MKYKYQNFRSVFSEKTDLFTPPPTHSSVSHTLHLPPPPPPTHTHTHTHIYTHTHETHTQNTLNFQFFYCCDLEIRSRSPNQFFVISRLYIHENLVRIQSLVHKTLCREESDMPMPMPMPTGSTPNTICLPSP